jgi:hypothetical protein
MRAWPAVAAAVALAAALLTGTAPAADDDVSLTVDDATVLFPGLLVMRGRVSGTTGWVEIQARKCGERSFSSFTSAPVDRGTWEIRAPGKEIRENAVIRAVWRRDRSAPVRIRVAPSPWMDDHERTRSGLIDVGLYAQHYYDGGKVYVQRLDRSTNRWRTVKTLLLKRSGVGVSIATFRSTFPKGTPLRALRRASKDGCYVEATSLVYVVK